MRRSRPSEGSHGSGSPDFSAAATDEAFWGAALGDFETQVQQRLERMSTALDAFAAEATGRASRVEALLRTSTADIRAQTKRLSEDSVRRCKDFNAILKTQTPSEGVAGRTQLGLRSSVTKAQQLSHCGAKPDTGQCTKGGASESRAQVSPTGLENASVAR